ncbi:MAG: hypothetical protein ABIH46_01305 [Chloroflexota bacterium]
MLAPTDRNSRIALAKGWTWLDIPEMAEDAEGYAVSPLVLTHWRNPAGKPELLPDWTGTLEGMAELMRELNERAKARSQHWVWGSNVGGLVSGPRDGYYCAKHGLGGDYFKWFWSDKEHPGDCVDDAWLSVFEEESNAGAN